MLNKKILAQSLAVVGLLAAASASQATITVYTSLAAFTAAVQSTGTDTFDNFNVNGTTLGPLNRTAGSFGYEAASATNDFFGAGTSDNPALSTNSFDDIITLAGFTGGVGAVGGNFFGSNILGEFAELPVGTSTTGGPTKGLVFVIEQAGLPNFTWNATEATVDSFFGFVSSSGAIVSVEFYVDQAVGGLFVWPTLDNLVLAAVPEPETYALLLAGLGIVGFMARRRRAD